MAFTDSNVFVTTPQILKFIRTKYSRQYVCKVRIARHHFIIPYELPTTKKLYIQDPNKLAMLPDNILI